MCVCVYTASIYSTVIVITIVIVIFVHVFRYVNLFLPFLLTLFTFKSIVALLALVVSFENWERLR